MQSTPLAAGFKAHLMAPILQGKLRKGKLPKWMNKWVDGTAIHCFYPTKMGEEYEVRCWQHFAAADIIRHDLRYEELLVCYPKKWVSEVENCCGILTGG